MYLFSLLVLSHFLQLPGLNGQRRQLQAEQQDTQQTLTTNGKASIEDLVYIIRYGWARDSRPP
jgi:hypothetical protein